MDACFGLFIESGNEWGVIAFTALASLVALIIANGIQRRWGHTDKQEAEEKATVETKLNQFGLRLESESELRRSEDTKEATERKNECASLGRDISNIREAFAYYCGASGKEKPRFGRSRSGDE